jgi:simple sugar transport system ATP-binding protein
MAVVLITHKLDEVLASADRITVMRRGEVVGELEAAGASADDIARAMVGRPVLLRVDKTPAAPKDGAALRIADLAVRRSRGDVALAGVSLQVRPGEIVGIAGVEGNGQRELVDAIAGLAAPERGVIELGGVDVTGATVGERLRRGLAHIPEDRHARGLVLEFSIAENLILGRDARFANRLGIDAAAVGAEARRAIAEHDIRPDDPDALAAGLSGGNQQKIVIARELSREPLEVLLASQPTRGVDVGAIERIHREIIAARDRGAAVLLVSAELSELRALSDRLLVIYKGAIVAELSAAELGAEDALERIGALMTGLAATEQGAGESASASAGAGASAGVGAGAGAGADEGEGEEGGEQE